VSEPLPEYVEKALHDYGNAVETQSIAPTVDNAMIMLARLKDLEAAILRCRDEQRASTMSDGELVARSVDALAATIDVVAREVLTALGKETDGMDTSNAESMQFQAELIRRAAARKS
jgi:hypothetical protein